MVAPGAVSLSLPFLADSDTLFALLVAPGPVSQALPFLADADLLFAPFVTVPALPPEDRIVMVAALARAARVEGLPRIILIT